MDQLGKVISIHDNMASLEVKRISGCGTNCSACSGACEIESEWIDIENTLDAKVGDYVEIRTDSSKVIKYMFILYGVPLLGLIIGIVIGSLLFNNDSYLLLTGLGFLILSALIVRLIDNKSKVSANDISYMEKILYSSKREQ